MNNILLNKIDAKNEYLANLKSTLAAINKKLDDSLKKGNKPNDRNPVCKIYEPEGFYVYFWSHSRTGNGRHTSVNC